MRHIAIVVCLLLGAGSQLLIAQDAVPVQNSPLKGRPGSDLLQKDWARIGPVLNSALQRMGPGTTFQGLSKTQAWNFSVGSAKNWWATDLVANTEYSVPSTCRAVGTNCYVFVSDSVWATRVTQQTVDSVRAAFDLRTPANASKGIYQLNTEYFGVPPNVDADAKIIILILDIRDGYSGGSSYTAGYFYGLNEYSEALVQAQLGSTRHSNQAEIYYLDANPANLTTASGLAQGVSTTAHEFQHMIHFNYDLDELTFVNEGMSESASRLCGYFGENAADYYQNTNVNFLGWDETGDVLDDYSRAMVFSWYLVEQFGNTLTKRIVSDTMAGVSGYNSAFAAMGSSLRFPDVLKNFAVATFVNDTTFDSRYGFRSEMIGAPTPHRTHLNPNVASTVDPISPYGTRYIRFAGGDSLTVTISSTGSLAVKAILKGPAGKRVDAVTLGVPYVAPSFGTSYTEVALAITNLTTSSQTYTYSSRGSGAITKVELIQDAGEPTGYLQSANGDTASVWFPAVAGGRIDSIRVALRRAGSITGSVWEYSGTVRPTPHGKILASGLTASVSSTPAVPYPVPWTNWATIDLRSRNLSAEKPFAVSFRCVGDPTTNPRVMINTSALTGDPTSLTYSTTSTSGANWYYYSANSAGDSVFTYLIRAYVGIVPLTPLAIYPGDANNDGSVDVRDVLPIGQYFGLAGPVRTGGSLAWQSQNLLDPWSPVTAAYADCDGNGTVAAADVQGILTNWGRTRAGLNPEAFDRLKVCEDLIEAIEASGSPSSASEAIRAEIQKYMQSTLGVSFDYALEQNWPNPFNPSTTIRFSVPEDVRNASLTIVNVLGQIVWQREFASLTSGRHAVEWNGKTSAGSHAASGVYFYRLAAGEYQSVKRMTLLK